MLLLPYIEEATGCFLSYFWWPYEQLDILSFIELWNPLSRRNGGLGWPTLCRILLSIQGTNWD